MECFLPYLCMVTVPLIMVRLERMLDYRGVALARFHCTFSTNTCTYCVPNLFVFGSVCTCGELPFFCEFASSW